MDAGEAVVAAVVAHFLKPEKYPLADSTTLLTVDGAGTSAAGEVVGAAAAGGCLEGGGSVFDRNIDKRPVDGGKVEGAVEEAEKEELEDGVLLVATVLWLCVC